MRRGYVATGVVAVLVAAVLTTAGAALATAAGVELRVPEGGEAIPATGVGFVTAVSGGVGVLIAAACARWSERPAQRFVAVTVALTAISLVPPLLSGADAATTVVLLGLHLLAAAVVVPPLARALGTRAGATVAA